MFTHTTAVALSYIICIGITAVIAFLGTMTISDAPHITAVDDALGKEGE